MNGMKKTGISGFTIVRNAQILEYPFEESVRSVLPLCDEFIINCGDSSDDTLKICERLERSSLGKVKTVHSVWDRHDQEGGWQLKSQTDTTMAYCREKWCFYIQADEVIHERDHKKILAAVAIADGQSGVDGLLFDYFHFYGGYNYLISGRNWYRREVRLFKNNRGIQAFRDAQGFRRGAKRLKVIPAGANVYHYGYVRSSESMRVKSSEMARWWGAKPATEAEAFKPRRHVGMRRFSETHPSVMSNRVGKARAFDPRRYRRKWDGNEIKNALTLVWEKVFPFRIGEFRNYEMLK